MPVILQHVDEIAPDLERRAKWPRVIVIGNDRPAPPHSFVQATSQAHREPLHRARKRAPALRFYNEMKMVALNRVLHEPRPQPLLGRAECRKHERRQRSLPETRKPSSNLHGDVQRMPLLEFRPARVRNACFHAGWLPTCALSSTAAEPETQLELP
jgi:hypothetical protein